MKNSIFTLVLFLVAHVSNAQVSLGGGIGISYSKASSDYSSADEKEMPIVSIPVSFIGEFQLNNALHLQTGLTVMRKGEAFRDTYTNGDYEQYAYHLNYIEMPVTIKLYLNKKKFRLHLLGGCYVAYLTGGTLKSVSKDAGNVSREKETLNLEDNDFTDPIDFGIKTGIGADISTKSGKIYIVPAFHLGLKDIDTDENYHFANRAFTINVGYLHTFKKNAKPAM